MKEYQNIDVGEKLTTGITQHNIIISTTIIIYYKYAYIIISAIIYVNRRTQHVLQEASARRPMQRALTTANSCRYFALTSTFTSYLGSVTLISKQMPAYSDLEDSFGDSNSEASASNYDMSSSSSSPEHTSSDDESPEEEEKLRRNRREKKSYLEKKRF